MSLLWKYITSPLILMVADIFSLSPTFVVAENNINVFRVFNTIIYYFYELLELNDFENLFSFIFFW